MRDLAGPSGLLILSQMWGCKHTKSQSCGRFANDIKFELCSPPLTSIHQQKVKVLLAYLLTDHKPMVIQGNSREAMLKNKKRSLKNDQRYQCYFARLYKGSNEVKYG